MRVRYEALASSGPFDRQRPTSAALRAILAQVFDAFAIGVDSRSHKARRPSGELIAGLKMAGRRAWSCLIVCAGAASTDTGAMPFWRATSLG